MTDTLDPGTDAAATRFVAADLLRQAMIQDLAVDPAGGFAVYSRRVIEAGKYRSRLWRVDLAGGEPTPLTRADAVETAPRISPDGATLLFLSDRDGRSRAWLLPLAGGEARPAAEVAGQTSAAEWSPDGARVLLLAESGVDRLIVGSREDPVARRITDFAWRWDGHGYVDQQQSLWVADLGGAARRLTPPEVNVASAAWMPDGRRVAFVADLDPDAGMRPLAGKASVWAVAADGPEGEPAPEPVAALPGGVERVAWSPAGRPGLIGSAVEHGPNWAPQRLWVVDDGGPRLLGADLDLPVCNTTFGDLVDPRSSVALAWQDDATLVALVGREGCALPYRFAADGDAAPVPLAEGDLVCSALACGGGRVVVVASDRGRPAEVGVVEDGAVRWLTGHGSDWLAPFRRDPVRHRVPHPDGHAIDVWVVPAAGTDGPAPTVIQIHGGPHASHGPTPWLEMLALADAGITVLYPNPRGSTGYGTAFAKAIHGDWGGPDADDHRRVAAWAVEAGIAAPGRVGVLGLSGGGFMVNWLLGHHPGEFRAGVSENPVTDLVSEYGASDLTAYSDDRFIGVGRLPEDLPAFLRHSPYTQIHRNEAPLLLLQCEDDIRCPPVHSDLVFAILRSRGRPVEMVRYPGESHYMVGIGRPDRRVDRIERIVDWFVRSL